MRIYDINNSEEFIDYMNVSKTRYDITRKGYNPHGKDAKRKTLARKRAINAKLARRPQ